MRRVHYRGVRDQAISDLVDMTATSKVSLPAKIYKTPGVLSQERPLAKRLAVTSACAICGVAAAIRQPNDNEHCPLLILSSLISGEGRSPRKAAISEPKRGDPRAPRCSRRAKGSTRRPHHRCTFTVRTALAQTNSLSWPSPKLAAISSCRACAT